MSFLINICLTGLLGVVTQAADPSSVTAKTLFGEGEAAYFVGDFDKAIVRFEAAYGVSKLPAILYNIGLTYYRRFTISGDVKDLKRARAVLQNFNLEVEQEPRLDNDGNVARLLTEIDAALAVTKQAAVDDAAVSSKSTKPLLQWRGHVAAGSALVGVGAGTLIAAVTLAIRGGALEDSFEAKKCSLYTPTMDCDSLMNQGHRTNIITTITAVAAPLLMAGGATLLTLGLKRRATHRRRVASPYIAPGSVGIVFQGRF